MRILFDGYWWATDPTSNRCVQRELILGWRQAFPTDQLAVAIPGERIASQLPDGIDALPTRLRPHALSNLIELGRHARRWRADAVVANDFAPAGAGAVTVMHDAMFLDHPAWYTFWQRRYFSAMIPSARFATVVATATQSEAHRIERHAWQLAPVTTLGIAPRTPIISAVPRRPAITEGLDGFALTFGRPGTRANIEASIAAVPHSTKITSKTPLIVVTDLGERALAARLPAPMRRLRDAGLVRIAKRLDIEELSWLYRHAAVCISLPRDESLGLSALEATWFDAPLLASDLPTHHEVAGGWAHVVPVDAPAEQVGAAIDQLWNGVGDEKARARILEQQTWTAAARALRAAVRQR